MWLCWVIFMLVTLCSARYFRHYWKRAIYVHTVFGITAFVVTVTACMMAWGRNWVKSSAPNRFYTYEYTDDIYPGTETVMNITWYYEDPINRAPNMTLMYGAFTPAWPPAMIPDGCDTVLNDVDNSTRGLVTKMECASWWNTT